jgi:hypothetical protein
MKEQRTKNKDQTKIKDQNWILRTGICLGFCSLILGFLVSGCAKTVTPTHFGQTMTVTVTLRGNADTTNNRYFLVLGHDNTFATPRPWQQDSRAFEFLEPDTPLYPGTNHTTAEYFSNFYDAWDGYLVLDNTQSYYLVHGPFTQGALVVRTPLTGVFTGGKTLTYTFQLNQIYTSLAGVPANAWFNVVAVSWPPNNTGLKLAADNLTTYTYVSTTSLTNLRVDNTFSIPSDQSLDIMTVEVSVQ